MTIAFMAALAHRCVRTCVCYLGSAKFRVYELVPPDQDYAQLSRHNPPARLDCYIVALADVVDVHRNGCICPDSILLHLGNELALG